MWIKESARGKGYGKEMIAGLINRLEAHKKFDYIVYRAHAENIATNKIATSFGGELQLDEQGNPKTFTEHKFDNSSSFEALEYRIPKK
ncbi:MAG: GNAT family N-acetyltransferase [bacterium]